MKATLSWTIPEEHDEFTTAVNAAKYKIWLWDFAQIIRGKLKHGDLSESEDKIWEQVKEEFYKCNDSGVELY